MKSSRKAVGNDKEVPFGVTAERYKVNSGGDLNEQASAVVQCGKIHLIPSTQEIRIRRNQKYLGVAVVYGAHRTFKPERTGSTPDCYLESLSD